MYRSPDYPRPHLYKVHDSSPPAYTETTPFESPLVSLLLREHLTNVRKHLLIFSAPAQLRLRAPLLRLNPGGYKDTSIELRPLSLMNLEFSGYQTCPGHWQSEAEWKDSPLSDYEFYYFFAPKDADGS